MYCTNTIPCAVLDDTYYVESQYECSCEMKSKFCYARTSTPAKNHGKYCTYFSNATSTVSKSLYFNGNSKNGVSTAPTLKCGWLIHQMLIL